MGLDLTLVPNYFRSNDWILAYARLPLERDYNIFSQIIDIGSYESPICKPLPFTGELEWYGGGG